MQKDDDISLPKATISKIIKEHLANVDIRCANNTRDLIAECCVEFVQMIAAEANEVCNKENRKTISAEHVIKSLKKLGYEKWVSEIEQLQEEHKLESMNQSKKSKKNNSGLTEEELLREQQRLFAQARQAHAQYISPTSPTISPTITANSPTTSSHVFTTFAPQPYQVVYTTARYQNVNNPNYLYTAPQPSKVMLSPPSSPHGKNQPGTPTKNVTNSPMRQVIPPSPIKQEVKTEEKKEEVNTVQNNTSQKQ